MRCVRCSVSVSGEDLTDGGGGGAETVGESCRGRGGDAERRARGRGSSRAEEERTCLLGFPLALHPPFYDSPEPSHYHPLQSIPTIRVPPSHADPLSSSAPAETQFKVPLIINDRLDIALALSCGLHVGQSDLPASLARQLLGPNALLGVSINTPAEMREVLSYEKGTVDYVGVGPCYGTETKKDLNPVMGVRGVRGILELLGESEIKAVVIGSFPSLPSSCLRTLTSV